MIPEFVCLLSLYLLAVEFVKGALDMFAYNIVSGILGSGDCQHEDQRHDCGEPGQRGDLRNHLKNTQKTVFSSLQGTLIFAYIK